MIKRNARRRLLEKIHSLHLSQSFYSQANNVWSWKLYDDGWVDMVIYRSVTVSSRVTTMNEFANFPFTMDGTNYNISSNTTFAGGVANMSFDTGYERTTTSLGLGNVVMVDNTSGSAPVRCWVRVCGYIAGHSENQVPIQCIKY